MSTRNPSDELATLLAQPAPPRSAEDDERETRAEWRAEERAWERRHRRLSRGEEQERDNTYERGLDEMWGGAA